MKISIITISYNSQKTIDDTLRSVTSQDYPSIEYLIVDGHSSDDTLKIVDRYKDKIIKVISEKDAGLYDALNKGIRNCTGDIIGMIHSDDAYYDNHVLSEVAEAFEKNPQAEALYGDLIFVDRDDTSQIKRVWRAGQYNQGDFAKGWMPPHPTFFVRKELYEKFGFFTTKLRYSSDYELMLRFIHINKIKLIYLPRIIVRMRMGGISNFSFLIKWKAHLEDRKAWHMNGLKPSTFNLIRKPLSKLGQYFERSV